MRRAHRTAIAGSCAAVAVAAAVTAGTATGGAELGGVGLMWWCAALAFGLNWLVFVPAMVRKTDRFFDATGSLTYLVTTGVALAATDVGGPRPLLAGALVGIWAIRLGSFLTARALRSGHDARFEVLRRDPLQFFMTWTLQGLWVTLTAQAAWVAITAGDDSGDWLLAVGVGVWLAGFGIEAVADRQKARFRTDPANAGSFITTGLWGLSRHPNYFGEILLWCGVALVAVPAMSGWRWLALVSPGFVYLLLTRISGIPLLDRRALERWGEDADYQHYRRTTRPLLPLPRR